MGCGAQVHEKTNTRGTWAYNSVDCWYLFTSSEHCHIHMCHVKTTKSKLLTNTLQLSHKTTTNLTIIHTDKVMNTIYECAAALREVAGGKTPQ